MLAAAGMKEKIERAIFTGSSMSADTKFDKAAKVCGEIENYYSHGDIPYNLVGTAIFGQAGGVRKPHLTMGYDGSNEQYVINKKIPNNKFPYIRSHEKDVLSPDFIKSVFEKVK
jgi:hypothetical protein